MSGVHPVRVVLKAILIFAAFNLAYAAFNPRLARLSIYALPGAGRTRLPAVAPGGHLLHVQDVDGLINSHIISSTPKGAGEFRVVLLGDSQTWGWTVPVSQSLDAYLAKALPEHCGRSLRYYNLGYPYPSAVRDFLHADRAMGYAPDLVVWLVTLNTFTPARLGDLPPQGSPRELQSLLDAYGLQRWDALIPPRGLLERTIVGQQAQIKDWMVLQLSVLPWIATDNDELREETPPHHVKLSAKQDYDGYLPPALPLDKFAFDVLPAMQQRLGETPLLMVNEPIKVWSGRNSDVRYDVKYPRWAYDQYRAYLHDYAAKTGVSLLDLWDQVPSMDFSTFDLHLTPEGEQRLAALLAPYIQSIACR